MRNIAMCENRPRGGLETHASERRCAKLLSHACKTHPMFLWAGHAGQK